MCHFDATCAAFFVDAVCSNRNSGVDSAAGPSRRLAGVQVRSYAGVHRPSVVESVAMLPLTLGACERYQVLLEVQSAAE